MESNQSHLLPQTDLEALRLKFFKNGIGHYKSLMKDRMKLFDKKGELEITNADGEVYRQFGDLFIEELIKYFEYKDSGPYFRMCADLKGLLKEFYKKFPQRKLRSNGLNELELARLDLFYACRQMYFQLVTHRTSLFEEDGTIITSDDQGKYVRNGRDYIMNIINYFADQDYPVYYKMSAKLKTVLDEYDAKFGKKEIDSI